MSYRKDQGRYARMVSFWSLTFLLGFGCFHGGGLVTVLNATLPTDFNTTLIDRFPLLGSLKVSTLIALAVVLLGTLLIHGILNKARIADALIDTESEMRKVTWPKAGETWNGALAVGVTVFVMFVFLTVVDVILLQVLGGLMGAA